jgi:hypothetical protein
MAQRPDAQAGGNTTIWSIWYVETRGGNAIILTHDGGEIIVLERRSTQQDIKKEIYKSGPGRIMKKFRLKCSRTSITGGRSSTAEICANKNW